MHQIKRVEELAEFLKPRISDRAVLTFHSIGDTDAVSSAVSLSHHMKNSSVATPDTITSNANRILDRLGYGDAVPNKFDDGAKIAILLDANNFEEFGQFSEKLKNFGGEILIIDHHYPNFIEKDNVYVFNDESYCATASIVYKLLGLLGEKVDETEAKLLLTGIISDSAELRNSTPETFEQIGTLLETAKTDYYSIRKLMSHILSPDARASAIKDLEDAAISIVDGVLFVYGKVHRHANLSADNAIRLGADVAIFYAENADEVSFSARLNTAIDKEYGLHLGRIMRSLAHIIGGTGGGHPSAAGAYGPLKNAHQEFLDAFIKECTKKIGEYRTKQRTGR